MKKIVGIMIALVLLAGAGVFAGTYDMTGGGTGNAGAAAIPSGLRTPVMLTYTLDFSKTNGAAGDLFKVMTFPSNTLVMAVWYRNVTTNTTAATYCLGDSTSTSKWASAVNMSAANSGTLAYGTTTNTLYLSPDYLTIEPCATAATGKIEVKAMIMYFN